MAECLYIYLSLYSINIFVMGLFTEDKPGMFDVTKYCLPAKVYLVLSLIGIILGGFASFRISTIIFHMCIIGLWTLLLNWLCVSGLSGLSWGLVIFPYLVMLLIFTVVAEVLGSSMFDWSNNYSDYIADDSLYARVLGNPPSETDSDADDY